MSALASKADIKKENAHNRRFPAAMYTAMRA
jgi:hypothetical protein